MGFILEVGINILVDCFPFSVSAALVCGRPGWVLFTFGRELVRRISNFVISIIKSETENARSCKHFR